MALCWVAFGNTPSLTVGGWKCGRGLEMRWGPGKGLFERGYQAYSRFGAVIKQKGELVGKFLFLREIWR